MYVYFNTNLYSVHGSGPAYSLGCICTWCSDRNGHSGRFHNCIRLSPLLNYHLFESRRMNGGVKQESSRENVSHRATHCCFTWLIVNKSCQKILLPIRLSIKMDFTKTIEHLWIQEKHISINRLKQSVWLEDEEDFVVDVPEFLGGHVLHSGPQPRPKWQQHSG